MRKIKKISNSDTFFNKIIGHLSNLFELLVTIPYLHFQSRIRFYPTNCSLVGVYRCRLRPIAPLLTGLWTAKARQYYLRRKTHEKLSCRVTKKQRKNCDFINNKLNLILCKAFLTIPLKFISIIFVTIKSLKKKYHFFYGKNPIF